MLLRPHLRVLFPPNHGFGFGRCLVTAWALPGPLPADTERGSGRARRGAAWTYIFGLNGTRITRVSDTMSALVPARDRRSVSSTVLVAKEVPDFHSPSAPSIPAFLPQSDETAFLAQFSRPHFVDSSTFQWTAHPCFRPRTSRCESINALPSGSEQPVLAAAPADARNAPVPITKLLATCIMALAPGTVVSNPPPQTKENLPHFRQITLLSDTQLLRLLPDADPNCLALLRKFAAICLDVTNRNLSPEPTQTANPESPGHAASTRPTPSHEKRGGARATPPRPTPSGTPVAAAPAANETRGGARATPPSPTPSGTPVAAAPAAHETRGGARATPPSPTPSGTPVAAAPAAHETRGGARATPPSPTPSGAVAAWSFGRGPSCFFGPTSEFYFLPTMGLGLVGVS